jgi:hypothetical protein
MNDSAPNKVLHRMRQKRRPGEHGVEPVEKVRWQKLQVKRPPYLPFKRRSQIKEPFWYPHFGQFSVVRDFFYSLVRPPETCRSR